MNYLEQFESEDILYHYTKTTTALEHILFNKKLRLSDRVDSNDPIEKLSYSSLVEIEKPDIDIYENIAKYSKDVEERIKQLKQVCFCMNDTSGRFQNRNDKPYEYYGCMKPRMWEQYADNYNGVCLIFSKAELLKQLDKRYTPNEVWYVSYADLENKKIHIKSSELSESNYKNCIKKTYDKMDKYIFHKHEDYQGENEYRICSYSDEVLEINIELAIKGLIVSENNSKYFKEKLVEYTKNGKIDIFRVDWKSDGVEVYNLKDWIEASKENARIAKDHRKRNLNKKE